MPEFYKMDIIKQTVKNLESAGVITPAAREHTLQVLSKLCDKDIFIFLIESHQCREMTQNNNKYQP